MSKTTQISELHDSDRLKIYNFIINACNHLYSKNKLQMDKFNTIVESFVDLSKSDPLFLAHLTSWAMTQESKDLKVLSVYFNSLNDANGEPFFKGSTKNKPNLRQISSIALQNMPPHLAYRVLELSRLKFGVKGKLSTGAHYPTQLKNAFRKYILYREENLDMIRGIKNSGMSKKFINMYKMLHMTPSDEAAAILGWKQKNRKITLDKLNFSNKSSDEIVTEITKNKLSPLLALSALSDKQMTAKIAKALLKNATGNQAIILQNLFRNKGFLEIDEIKLLFNKKIKTATTAVDRIDTLSKNVSDSDKKELSDVRSTVRKNQVGDVGKLFLHIDGSYSMQNAIEFAKEKTAIIAECINNPSENFGWGIFGRKGYLLKKPTSYTKEDFYEILYGVTASASATDCLACYEMSRKFGSDVDIFITDQVHNVGNILTRLKEIHSKYGKPSAVVIVHFGVGSHLVKDAFEMEGVPVSELSPSAITESALVTLAIKSSIKGQLQIIDEIMETPLLSLPSWWNDTSLENNYKLKLESINICE